MKYIIFVFIANVLATSDSRVIECSTNIKCRCSLNSEKVLVANCSSSNITVVPEFNYLVRIINLSENKISELPKSGKIPFEIRKLNLSRNEISNLSFDVFQGMTDLEELDLSYNQLNYNYFVFEANIFDDMERLEYLNIKNNYQFPVDNCTYPIAIGSLGNLRRLLIDGVENATFPKEFRNLKKLESLDLSGHSGRCHIVHLRSGMFKNVPTLWHLNLTNCNLRTIENGTFRDLVSLRTLNLSDNNYMSFKIMANATFDVQFTNLTILALSRIHCVYGIGTTLFLKDVKHLMNTSIEEIYLDGNKLENVQMGVLIHLPKTLRFISVSQNRFYFGLYLMESSRLQTLEKLDVSLQFSTRGFRKNGLRECYDWRGPEIPSDQAEVGWKVLEFQRSETELDWRDTELPSIQLEQGFRSPELPSVQSEQSLRKPKFQSGLSILRRKGQIFENIKRHKFPYIDSNQGARFFNNNFSSWSIRYPPFPIPPNMKIFYGRTSSFHSTIGSFRVSGNRVTEIHLQGNWFHYWKGPVFGFNKLEYLDLSYNMCANVSNVFFDEFRKLRVLNVSNNNLGWVFENNRNIESVFKNLVQLRYLDISYNRIFSFPRFTFRNLTNLESLILSHNLLINLNVDISHMTKLKHLDISFNQIAFLNKSTRSAMYRFSKLNNLTINMKGNIIRCNCDNLEFVEWLYEKRHIFIHFEGYKCRLFNNSLLSASRLFVLLTELHRDCFSYAGLVAGVMAAILLSTCILVCGLLYRYRWRLKYLYYITKSKYRAREFKEMKVHKYELDAFVSYANEDSDFINTMIKTLESESGCKLCIHQRDFIPGRGIAENITNAIQRSRRTIIVLTNNYLNSYWCMFEFNMARMESIYKRDGEDVMFMILYQHVPPRDLPLPLMDLIQSNSYIEFPDEQLGQEVFWNKIKETITD